MITFLDFDGVIVDSIEECYIVSKEAYYGHSLLNYPVDEYKDIFYRNRGLVKPAYEYRALHRAIELYMKGETRDVESEFKNQVSVNMTKNDLFFEKEFFYIRKLHRDQNFDAWISMNPLTEFGKVLENKDNLNTCIVTTKNREATEDLLTYYNIGVLEIYANDEVKKAGSKGNLLKEIMDIKKYTKAVFVDDSIEHLDTVIDDRISCYFADWGYGKNSDYNIYQYKC
jgi:phosphoglycolate phosphatase-like HAD superfamily hydrolase